jgi:parallel beta-helix repeat protein
LENTVSENMLENNFFGILCERFESSNISDNIFKNNILGLTLYQYPYNNLIANNSFYNDGLIILGENSGNIFLNNTLNEKMILVLENESDKYITENVGQIILIYCNNITIEGKEFSNTSACIQIINSDECNIIENNLTDNVFGIYVDSSFNTIIYNNNISDNLLNGITLISCFESKISGNTITRNGDLYFSYHGYLDIIEYLNISGGIFFISSFENNISDNTISENYENGIIFIVSCKNIISENDISGNKENGISFIGSSKNNIFKNQIKINNETGILLIGSLLNRMVENTFINNRDDAYFVFCILNRWKRNYWSESRILPKKIEGEIGRFNWFNVDWRPAQEPYDI